ncbi:MAG TPA: hypothetical protein VLM85_13830 [Polyangiaceae bacterium]|nr:hypothetical protein [Polyangiaceae bacterium]
MKRRTLHVTSVLLGVGALISACYWTSPQGTPGSPDGGPVVPFQADDPFTYVAKVKNILTGLPPTDAEVQKVVADPSQLTSLIDGWMQTPQYQQKMIVFFSLAFQQSQISSADFMMMIPNGFGGIGSSTQIPLLVQNASESFARTALRLIADGRPFTDLFTTTSFMMTPPLMELYAFMDANQVDDSSKITDTFKNANPTLNLYVEAAAGPIPLSETLDPKSANYMHWYYPALAKAPNKYTGCNPDPRIYGPATAGQSTAISAHQLHYLMYGALDNYKDPAGDSCGSYNGDGTGLQFASTDFDETAWKLVSIRQPNTGEATTRFYDAPTLKATTELVTTTPRVGFFSTPAFNANWQTNTSNQMRVTVNQALIVATGMQVDGTDSTVPPSTPGLDSTHSAANTECYSCHQTLDPTRSILSATYSYNYGNQVDTKLTGQKGLFAFQGHIVPVNTIADFGSALASHPGVAKAWVEKLCYWVNSQPCATDDPEFLRIVADFQNGFQWNTLVRELLSSPITTNATQSKTAAEEGELVAVSRRDHLCAALNYRLGYQDVCGLNLLATPIKGSLVPSIAVGMPSDAFGRGTVAPIVPNQPTMFYRAAIENLCEAIAKQLIDNATPIAGTKTYSSTSDQNVNAAIADFVQNLMAIVPSDPRSVPVTSLLRGHYDAAMKITGTKATDALKSTFTVACTSPTVIGIGM